MRKFSSYGPVDKDLHYYVPRQALVDFACQQLLGENSTKGGHYITVWAPRQRGKTWVMQQVLWRLQQNPRFAVVKINLQSLKDNPHLDEILAYLTSHLATHLAISLPIPENLQHFETLFTAQFLDKPLILILDEFDALTETAISGIVNVFRNIYIHRQEKVDYLLHGVALIGVRAVLGIENQRGSPFNVQRSLHIPNLTEAEVNAMYRWYERESGQPVAQAVIDRVFYETQGQPGLVSWLGELLTETYNDTPDQPLSLAHFERIYAMGLQVLPNNNIINIISKAKQAPYREVVLKLFRTRQKTLFRYDDARLNFLYLNGVIDWELAADNKYYAKFPCPFVQKRLFNYFAFELFQDSVQLAPRFDETAPAITETSLHVKAILRLCETYLHDNRDWLWRNVPRRQTDLRPYEAVYHFILYTYLDNLLRGWGGHILPEFPTGNGKIDLIIHHAGQLYGIEVKSFSTAYAYRQALQQAAHYGRQLGLTEITLAMFIQAIDEANRNKYETPYHDDATGVTVNPVFVVTG